MPRKKIETRLVHRLFSHVNRRVAMVVAGICVLGAAALIRWGVGSDHAKATPPTAAQRALRASSAAQKRLPNVENQSPQSVVAQVNGRKITRAQLGHECLRDHGKKVLETVMNRYLISLECQRLGVAVTAEETDKEIDRTARRFGLPVDQWLSLLADERGISPSQYRDEIIWPTLALRQLAATNLEVTDDEILEEFESRFGPKVQIRLIAVEDRDLAVKVHAALMKKPDDFARFAARYSKDINSASAGGLVQPVCRHMGEPTIEKVAFGLQEGEISPVVPVGDQFFLLKCERHIDARPPGKTQLEQQQALITEAIRDRKLRQVGGKIFRDLQDNARVENVFNDPAKRRQMPGVAAIINGHQIALAELEKSCITRHGEEVLESMVNRVLIEMALAESRRTVAREDVDAEVARAAIAAGITTRDGRADLTRWIEMMTQEQDVTQDSYVNNIVWPTVALKVLVADRVEVTNEDMQKGFEANYGPRVRVRAIVMNNLRRAQSVWDIARRDLSMEKFAELAAEYSVDPGSRALGGVVPPIQKHGGQTALEREAFKMRPGDLSSVIPVGNKYIILYCEGVTKPVVVEMADVQEVLHEDLLEKKFRIVMAREFEDIIGRSRITNYLNPEASHTPKTRTSRRAVESDPRVGSRG